MRSQRFFAFSGYVYILFAVKNPHLMVSLWISVLICKILWN